MNKIARLCNVNRAAFRLSLELTKGGKRFFQQAFAGTNKLTYTGFSQAMEPSARCLWTGEIATRPVDKIQGGERSPS